MREILKKILKLNISCGLFKVEFSQNFYFTSLFHEDMSTKNLFEFFNFLIKGKF